jgi:hypothetical protein
VDCDGAPRYPPLTRPRAGNPDEVEAMQTLEELKAVTGDLAERIAKLRGHL